MPKNNVSIRTLAAEAVQRGAIDLSQGVVHVVPPKCLFELFAKEDKDYIIHGYGPSQGDPVFLEAVANLLQREAQLVNEDNMLATAGVIGGIFAALYAHCQPEDKVLVPEPCFSGYPWVIEAARCKPVYIPHSASWEPDWNQLKAEAIDAKAILIANPSNPSGYVHSREDIRNLLEIANEFGLLVIADEIYSDFIWDGEFVSFLSQALQNDKIVVLRGFSKSLAVAGWRVGYAVSTPNTIEKMTAAHDTVCPGGVSVLQRVIGQAWLERKTELEEFIEGNKAVFLNNRNRLAEILRKIGMEPFVPKGAIYMMAKHNRQSDMAAMEELLEKGVVITPARVFYGSHKETSLIRAHFAVTGDTIEKVNLLLV